jgi:ubiquinone/menaquinone biosynthesis C-methylase UbiE
MNRFENWFCDSSCWRALTRRAVLPWLLQGLDLGDHVLEIGSGPGAGTEELLRRAGRVTSLDYSHEYVGRITHRDGGAGLSRLTNAAAVQGDALALPFREKTFSAVTAVLVLHHLKSREAQDRAFAEAFRVLRPGGTFVALEIQDGWMQRFAHIGSTFVPLAPNAERKKLETLGFTDVEIAGRRGAFRMRAFRPR